MGPKDTGDFVIGAVFAALGAGIVVIAMGYAPLPGTIVGPGLFPLITGAAMVLFGGVLCLRAWRTPAERIEIVHPDAAEGVVVLPARPLLSRFALGIVAILTLTSLLMQPLGFIVTGIVASIATVRLSGGSWTGALIFSPIATLILFYIFVHVFGVPLPRGVIG